MIHFRWRTEGILGESERFHVLPAPRSGQHRDPVNTHCRLETPVRFTRLHCTPPSIPLYTGCRRWAHSDVCHPKIPGTHSFVTQLVGGLNCSSPISNPYFPNPPPQMSWTHFAGGMGLAVYTSTVGTPPQGCNCLTHSGRSVMAAHASTPRLLLSASTSNAHARSCFGSELVLAAFKAQSIGVPYRSRTSLIALTRLVTASPSSFDGV